MVTRLRGVRWLVLSTFMVGSASVVGCGSDDSTPAADTDGGDGGDGGIGALTDARTDSPVANPDSGLDATVPDAGRDTGTTNPDSGPDAAGDGGPAAASFPTTAIDFGLSDCGGTAATKALAIQNTGGSPLTVTASVTGSFTVTPSLTVAPGQTGTLALAANVGASATAGTALTGVLTLQTNDTTKASTTVNLSVTPQGASLVYATGSANSAAFGTAKLNVAAANLTLSLRNAGNKPAVFTFGAPADAQFSLATAPVSPATLNANDTVTVTAGFKPTGLTAATSSSAITVSGTVCAGSTGSIAFTGQGSVGAVTGWPTAALDFGSGTCGGAAPAAKTFTLTNSGGVDATITAASFANAVGYTTDLTVGKKVPAGGTLVVTVTPPAIPTPSVLPGNYGDTLTVTTDIVGDTSHAIAVTEKAQGAILAFDTTATANFGAFGAVSVGSTASQPFAIVNTGTGPATVGLVTTGPFGVNTASVTVAAGTSAGDAVTFAPSGIAGQTGSVALSPAAGICQPLPAAIPLAGSGLNGGIQLSATSLSFTAACGTTALMQQFTITNNGNVPTAWTGKLGKTATPVFDVDSTGSTLAPGATATVHVTPRAIPSVPTTITPSAFSDVFTISAPTVVGGQDQLITLSQVPLGAVITVTPTAGLPFGNVPINTRSPTQGFTLTNSGNAGSPTPTVTLTSSSNALFPLDTSTVSVPAGGGSATANATFVPGGAAAPQSGTITFAIGGPTCAAPPAPLPVSGIGTPGPVITDASPWNFGGVNCGATAATQLPRPITNGGPTNFNITSIALGKGAAASPFILTSDASTVVVANGPSFHYTISAKPIPQAVPASDLAVAATTYNDTLTFTTDAPGDVASHVIMLVMNPQGVILDDVATTWNFGSSSSFRTPVTNEGNVATTLTLTVNADPGVFTLSPSAFPILPNATTQLTATFSGAASTAYSDLGTLSVPVGTVFCQPLPASYKNLTVTGQKP